MRECVKMTEYVLPQRREGAKRVKASNVFWLNPTVFRYSQIIKVSFAPLPS